ncbi:MAG: glycoside hydrolase family 127 protein, partial [Planctomycetota bacterium]
MRSAVMAISWAIVTVGLFRPAQAGPPKHRKLEPVPFTDVKVDDAFWAPRLATNREVSIPHNFKWCEETGRFSNFAKAGGLMEGEFEGIYFNDSDVYKVLQGASYSLADHPDPKLDAMVDAVIAKIAAAQQENGYLNTYYTLKEPDNKWTNCRVRHELYCAGHLFEAAVAHHRATGKTTLLDVATRFADRIDEIFGPGKRYDVPGHEEIELALVKLSLATGQSRYFELARFFLDVRGVDSKREVYGPYCQDHVPVRNQSEVVGHAVRAMYLYSGMADVAGHTGDEELLEALGWLWEDVVQRKMYVTGGVGARHGGESFGEAYELPNASAYCETCAAIGLALWSHRLNLMHGDAQYADVLERVVYNGALSGIDLDGEHFFYVNPLESAGRHHREPFFGCACCPTNVVRFVPSLPGYVYATGKAEVTIGPENIEEEPRQAAVDALYVNLYVAGTAQVTVGDTKVKITQQTDYPWDGKVRITLHPERPAKLALCCRVPSWAAKVHGNESAVAATSGGSVNRYIYTYREWKPGDWIEWDFPMEIQRIEAHPKVEANHGRVAVQRGPIVYCFEAVDNGGSARSLMLPHDPKLVAEHRPDLLGGVTVIRGVDREGRQITVAPYCAWDQREPGEMIVWVRQDGKSRPPDANDPAWLDKLYRPLDPATLGPSIPLTIPERSTPSASHQNP